MKEKNYKKCVICGKEYPCTPSRNVVTCSRECRLKYLSQNHKGLKMSAATRREKRFRTVQRYRGWRRKPPRKARNLGDL